MINFIPTKYKISECNLLFQPSRKSSQLSYEDQNETTKLIKEKEKKERGLNRSHKRP